MAEAREIVAVCERKRIRLFFNDHWTTARDSLARHFMGIAERNDAPIRSLNDVSLQESFGQISRIQPFRKVLAWMVESGFVRTEWLAAPEGGGVISDLAPHPISYLDRLGIWGESPKLRKITAEVYDKRGWRQMKKMSDDEIAETKVNLAYTTEKNVDVRLTLGKIGDRRDIAQGKFVTIKGSGGRMTVDFASHQAELVIGRDHHQKVYKIGLTKSPYQVMYETFLHASRGLGSNYVYEGLRSVTMVEEARKRYKYSSSVDGAGIPWEDIELQEAD